MKQLPPCRLKDKERVPVKCNTCGKEFTVSYSQIKRRGPDYKWHCRSCSMNNLSKEEKEKRSNKIKDALGSKTEEEKQAMIEKRLQTIMTPEFRKAMKEKVQTCWKNKSEEELKRISEKASKNTQRIWDTMDKDVKEKRLNKMFVGFDNWWANLSDEDKEKKAKENGKRSREYWGKVSEEYKIQHGQKSRDWYSSLSEEDKKAYIHKRLSSKKSDKNKLNMMFESMMNNTQYKYKEEYHTIHNGVEHDWDYAIFSNGKLEMLVDLDGVYFHADDCDYDGIHSEEYYDSIRGLSVPDGIKWCIIQEKSFDQGFNYMMKSMDLSYDEFIKERYKEYKTIPFPAPSYTNMELLRAFNQLLSLKQDDMYHHDMSVDTKVGNRIIQQFHQSIWRDNRVNDISPYEAFNDNKILMDMIKDRVFIHSYLNKNKILQGFTISPVGRLISFVSPGLIKMIINKYLDSYSTIFNPNNRYSEILLGAISLGKQYIGIERNEVRYDEANNMIQFFNNYQININASVSNNIEGTSFPCMLTWVDSDDQIDLYMKQFRCGIYLFITDTDTKYEYKNINKYKLITKEV